MFTRHQPDSWGWGKLAQAGQQRVPTLGTSKGDSITLIRQRCAGTMAGGRTQLMRAAAFNSHGGPHVLQPCLWSKPAAAPGRVLVRVVAAGLNPIDCKIRAGEAFPFTPLTKLPKRHRGAGRPTVPLQAGMLGGAMGR